HEIGHEEPPACASAQAQVPLVPALVLLSTDSRIGRATDCADLGRPYVSDGRVSPGHYHPCLPLQDTGLGRVEPASQSMREIKMPAQSHKPVAVTLHDGKNQGSPLSAGYADPSV